MAVKVRADLVAVAVRVQKEFADPSSPFLTPEQIEAAIAAQGESAPGARPFNDDEFRALVRLRSQSFKAPDKRLRIV